MADHPLSPARLGPDRLAPRGTAAAVADVEVALESLSQWQLAARRFRRHRLALIGVVVLAFMTGLAVIGPAIDPYNPVNIPGAVHPGGDPPSLAHPFGTDPLNRDLLARLVVGARISLAIAGLRALARTQKPGLRALMRAAGVDPAAVDAGAVGFRLGPRINAAGRLGHPRAALELPPLDCMT